MLGDVSDWSMGLFSLGGEVRQVLAIQIGEPQAMCGLDDQVEHRPAQTQAARLAWETANHFRSSAHSFE